MQGPAQRRAQGQTRGKLPVVLPEGRARLVVAGAAIVVVLVLIVAFVVPTCSQRSEPTGQSAASASSEATEPSASASSAESSPSSAAQDEAPKTEELNELIGEEEAGKLVAQAESSEDARWIAAHPEAFAFDGPEVQAKVLKLAADDPLALSFVRYFPDKYSQETPSDDAALALDSASPSPNVPSTNVPHLYQWDSRWGYTVYNADAFGLSGCGPTSLAMVYQALTGKSDRSPYDMGQLAYEGDYVVEWLGTANDFFTEVVGQLGLECEVLEPSAEAITQALKSGKPIVANLGVGTFTSYGHFFVLAGVADNGEIIVNDPYSATRSSQTWGPQVIASESVALYAYSLAS